jgi:hypothetical protein
LKACHLVNDEAVFCHVIFFHEKIKSLAESLPDLTPNFDESEAVIFFLSFFLFYIVRKIEVFYGSFGVFFTF